MIDQEKSVSEISSESIALLKGALKAYMVTMPPALKEKYATAMDEEDASVLSEFVNLIDTAFSYINEKDREEGARHAELRNWLQAWIDSILAR